MKNNLLILSAGLLVLVSGCASTENLQDSEEKLVFKNNEKFCGRIAAAISQIHPKARILVADFVTVNNLKTTDGLGRITAEQLAGQLAEHGLIVIDPRVMKDKNKPTIGISSDEKDSKAGYNAGEFSLTRTLEHAEDYGADYILTGTFSYGLYTTIVNIKALDSQGVLRFASNYTVPADVSFDWDQHSLKQFNEYNEKADRRVREYWDPYKRTDAESDIR